MLWWMICKGADDQFWLRCNEDGDALCQRRKLDWLNVHGDNIVSTIAENHAIRPKLTRKSSKAIQKAVGLPFKFGEIPVTYGSPLLSTYSGASSILFGDQDAGRLLWEEGSSFL